MKEIEVAVAYTDNTWNTVFIEIPDTIHPGNAYEYAEEEALKRTIDPNRAVAFVKVVWECTEEEQYETQAL